MTIFTILIISLCEHWRLPRYISIAVVKTMTKSNMRKKGFILASIATFQSTTEEVKAGTWRQKLKQRPQRNAAYWIVSHGWLI